MNIVNVNDISKRLAELTVEKPIFIHLDAIALMPLGENKGTDINDIISYKLNVFNEILNYTEELGGNVIIPTFSYSATDGTIYDVKNSESKVGRGTDFLRKKNYKKRTKDPIFSYLIFSKKDIFSDEMDIKEFNSFGKGSIIDKVFKMNGYVGSIGNVLWRITEFHYLEKKLGVKYRFDKKFKAKIKDLDNKIYDTSVIFFCRDLTNGKIAFFKPLINELKKRNIINRININGLMLDFILFKDVYKVMKELYYLVDKEFFLIDEEEGINKL
jgi:aminoglycoside 3-N-acetyltransferase